MHVDDLPGAAILLLLGLICMTCDGAQSHEECDSKGKLKRCLANEVNYFA